MEHISEIMERMKICQEVLKRKEVSNLEELQELYKNDTKIMQEKGNKNE